MSDGRLLQLDLGNTRAKWRLYSSQGGLAERGEWLTAQLAQCDVPAAGDARDRAQLVSVAAEDVVRGLEARLEALGYGRIARLASGAVHGRLRSGYDSPERLGADRWAALVAGAQACAGAFAVVDAGSALTVDLVAASGQHLGGWIVPGLALARASLLRGTAGVRFDASCDLDGDAPGRDTEAAVARGTLLMAGDFVRSRLVRFQAEHGACPVFLTGGDGPRLASRLEMPCVECPDLVLDGLTAALD